MDNALSEIDLNRRQVLSSLNRKRLAEKGQPRMRFDSGVKSENGNLSNRKASIRNSLKKKQRLQNRNTLSIQTHMKTPTRENIPLFKSDTITPGRQFSNVKTTMIGKVTPSERSRYEYRKRELEKRKFYRKLKTRYSSKPVETLRPIKPPGNYTRNASTTSFLRAPSRPNPRIKAILSDIQTKKWERSNVSKTLLNESAISKKILLGPRQNVALSPLERKQNSVQISFELGESKLEKRGLEYEISSSPRRKPSRVIHREGRMSLSRFLTVLFFATYITLLLFTFSKYMNTIVELGAYREQFSSVDTEYANEIEDKSLVNLNEDIEHHVDKEKNPAESLEIKIKPVPFKIPDKDPPQVESTTAIPSIPRMKRNMKPEFNHLKFDANSDIPASNELKSRPIIDAHLQEESFDLATSENKIQTTSRGVAMKQKGVETRSSVSETVHIERSNNLKKMEFGSLEHSSSTIHFTEFVKNEDKEILLDEKSCPKVVSFLPKTNSFSVNPAFKRRSIQASLLYQASFLQIKASTPEGSVETMAPSISIGVPTEILLEGDRYPRRGTVLSKSENQGKSRLESTKNPKSGGPYANSVALPEINFDSIKPSFGQCEVEIYSNNTVELFHHQGSIATFLNRAYTTIFVPSLKLAALLSFFLVLSKLVLSSLILDEDSLYEEEIEHFQNIDDAETDEDEDYRFEVPEQESEDDDTDLALIERIRSSENVSPSQGRYECLEIAKIRGTPRVKIRSVRRSRRLSKRMPETTSIPLDMVVDSNQILHD